LVVRTRSVPRENPGWFEANDVRLPHRCKPCRSRRRAARDAEERLTGTVVLVRPDYGFIEGATGQYYFRATDVSNGASLAVGDPVVFRVGDRASGPRPRATLVELGGPDPLRRSGML
jgi:hypothetical protein